MFQPRPVGRLLSEVFKMLRTVLITGGSGFLGINLVRKLREKGVETFQKIGLEHIK